ncbi:MAG: hypothetical protein H6733_05910 [Alphaproteobacteria bacterium]|nr:hypothetical protein [Alphaproteobacteria bacterium]
MAGFFVDEMGNCWADDDVEQKFPVMPHPELEGDDALCPSCGHYKWRRKLSQDRFEWRCGCGRVFDGFHH